MMEKFEKTVASITKVVKRKRDEMFALDSEDDWSSYFHHLFENLTQVCAANLIIKETLRKQVGEINKQERRPRVSAFPKCKETKSLVENGSSVIMASRKYVLFVFMLHYTC